MSSERHPADCSCTRCVGFQPGNEMGLRHGALSERQIRPVARNHRRRVLRQIGLSPRDLDPIGKAHLDLYVRLMAKVELIDVYVGEHGLIRDGGEPQPAMRLYVSLANSARLALGRLEDHLRSRRLGPDPLEVLEGLGRKIAARNGGT